MNTNTEDHDDGERAVYGRTIKFYPGQVAVTPAALAALEKQGRSPLELLGRHVAGDWGDLFDEDRRSNDQALRGGHRLLSSYDLGGDVRIWVITEADRLATTLLLPSDY
ncbi:hypothetical protein [Caldimonas tepidiphila]|uniref:hypothetical protein n=1 Tax=Caldimonas tepidiphila TaxID=2315841 RepID=UPI000E5BC811|nr:hypothetical protein [Caldimonas tepidiphila]